MPEGSKRPRAGGAQGRGRGRGGGSGRGDKQSRRTPATTDGDSAIRKLAAKHWPATTPAEPAEFDAEVVQQVYRTYLSKPASGRAAASRLTDLEVSGYLERYLWPNLAEPATAPWEHVMSVIALVNLKTREGAPAWEPLRGDTERFAAFFTRAIDLPTERAAPAAMSFGERAGWVSFFVHAFASLEDEVVRAHALRLVSLPMWETLTPPHLKALLASQPQLARPWKFLSKRRAKEAKLGEPPASSRQERSFIPGLLSEFLKALALAGGEADEEMNDAADDDDDADDADECDAEGAEEGAGRRGAAADGRGANGRASLVRYLERTLELIIDLLAQLPTRRFFHAVLLGQHILERAALSAFATSCGAESNLFRQLLEMAKFYEAYEIDDHRGTPLTETEAKTIKSEQLQALQRASFRMEGLRDFSLANLSAIDTGRALYSHFSRLATAQLGELTLQLGLVHTAEQAQSLGKPFLVQLLVSRYERRVPQHETICALPLYPDEATPWDHALVPTRDYIGDSCLALPKLNLQFLTVTDYLMRNFSLFRLESVYEIKEDIEDVCERLQPRRQLSGKTVFRGWARMALPLAEFKLYKVGRPFLGEAMPSEARAEATVSLGGVRQDVASEWSSLRKHDVVFVLTLRATTAEGEKADPSAPFPEQVGLVAVRGAEVMSVSDEEGHVFTGESEQDQALRGKTRKLDLQLDTAQYHLDAKAVAESGAPDVYQDFNVIMRRKPKENNFKAILQCIRDLMVSPLVVPEWLNDVLLGYGDPASASYWNLPAEQAVTSYDFFDTFLDVDHVAAAFPQADVTLSPPLPPGTPSPAPPYLLTIPAEVPRTGQPLPEGGAKPVVTVTPYDALVAGPYPEDMPRMNGTRYTPMQVEAIRAAMNPGLSMVVGPPGTGKTDTAVQIISNLAHNFPTQRLLIITHSNQALNDIFEKLMNRDIDERYLLRLGHGEELLETEKDFSRPGRVNHMLKRRLELLVKVERLGLVVEATSDVGYTCETAQYFFHSHVLAKWEEFCANVAKRQAEGAAPVALLFPFTDFFADAPQPLFKGHSYDADLEVAKRCYKHLERLFEELDECRAFEILRSTYDRGNFLLTKHAKVIAMTCTHAAIKRRDLVALGFQYDTLIMEEAAQIMEIETFIPMVLQNPDAATGKSRLKRVVLIGDHHQLPPVVKNAAFQKYSKLDQSLFTRFVRLGVPATTLDQQGRARSAMADLYRWRYDSLGDLPAVASADRFRLANAGFARPFQFVDVPDLNGVGESSPMPYYIQNLAEAEFVVATFMYMRLQGIAASRISIITTYNGQKDLIGDVLAQRCSWSPLFGSPAKIATTDKFQGQQNDFILLSLVRTKTVGHLRDVRRLVVAMSRARLGLYVFGRRELFEPVAELRPTFQQLLALPDKLSLLPAERAPATRAADDVPAEGVLEIESLSELGELVSGLTERAEAEREAASATMAYANAGAHEADDDDAAPVAAAAPSRGARGADVPSMPEAPPSDDED